MKKNCKEFLCDDAGNCEEKLKSGNHTSDIFKADAVADAVFQQPDKPSPAGNHIAANALSVKIFNRGFRF